MGVCIFHRFNIFMANCSSDALGCTKHVFEKGLVNRSQIDCLSAQQKSKSSSALWNFDEAFRDGRNRSPVRRPRWPQRRCASPRWPTERNLAVRFFQNRSIIFILPAVWQMSETWTYQSTNKKFINLPYCAVRTNYFLQRYTLSRPKTLNFETLQYQLLSDLPESTMIATSWI